MGEHVGSAGWCWCLLGREKEGFVDLGGWAGGRGAGAKGLEGGVSGGVGSLIIDCFLSVV